MSKHVIYAFIDQNKKVFYIGQTNNFNIRRSKHKNEVEKGNRLYAYNKLRKVMRDHGLTIKDCMVIIEKNISSDFIDDKEIYYISLYRQLGNKLTNLTDGGRGSSGFTKDIHSRCRKSREGYQHSEETKKKISDSHKGMKFSKEHKNNLSKARKKRITTPETRNKMSKTSTGKINIKHYILTDPNGNEHSTPEGLSAFCREHDLQAPVLCKVIKGTRKHHKGWTIRKAQNET